MNGRIEGKVVLRTGDFMPPEPSGKEEPLKTRILVFFPPIDRGECVRPEEGLTGWRYVGLRKPLATINTDANGCFNAEIPPGNYSFFIEYDGGPYIGFGAETVGEIQIENGTTHYWRFVVNRGTD